MDEKTDSSTGWDGTFERLPKETVLGITKRQFMEMLEPLMRRACLAGIHVFVRVDPERDHNCFTVLIGKSNVPQIRRDTDDPARIILEALKAGDDDVA